MSYYRENLDWDLIGEYFSLFKQDKKFKELKLKYGKVE